MRIYIPTYKRVGKQVTLRSLPPPWLERTWLVVRPEERTAHNFPRVLVCAEKGVPAARQAAMEHCPERMMFMFDDDLRFAVRQPDWDYDAGRTKLQKATMDDIARGLFAVEHLLGTVPMVGWDARGGNNQRPEKSVKYFCRIMRAFGVDRYVLRKEHIRFDTYPFWEDFHVALALIHQGHKIANLMRFTNDASTNTAGGVSTYRTDAALRECRDMFCLEHEFAEPIDKRPKSWGGSLGSQSQGIPDLKIFWQKAAKSAGSLP